MLSCMLCIDWAGCREWGDEQIISFRSLQWKYGLIHGSAELCPSLLQSITTGVDELGRAFVMGSHAAYGDEQVSQPSMAYSQKNHEH